MSKHDPLISVVMPVYNASKYLEEALVSVLIQSYENFELLAINDGSVDNSIDILNKYATFDKRIKVISQKNQGIVAVLNRGVQEARGQFVARMDADDVSFPHRFASQIEAFKQHPEAVLVYGNFEVMDEQSQFLYRELVPPLNEDLQQALFLRNPIAHGSVMFRKSIIDTVGGYSDKFGPTEDLELWMRIADHGDFVGTGTPLYRWRINSAGITMTNNAESQERGKEHNEKKWTRSLPRAVTRSDIVRRTKYYLNTYPDFGHFYKIQYLEDRAHIATKLMRKGHAWRGVKELIFLSSTGRTGLKIVLARVSLLCKVSLKKILRRGDSDG